MPRFIGIIYSLKRGFALMLGLLYYDTYFHLSLVLVIGLRLGHLLWQLLQNACFSACDVLMCCGVIAWQIVVSVTYTCRTFLQQCLTQIYNEWRPDNYCTMLRINSYSVNGSSEFRVICHDVLGQNTSNLAVVTCALQSIKRCSMYCHN